MGNQQSNSEDDLRNFQVRYHPKSEDTNNNSNNTNIKTHLDKNQIDYEKLQVLIFVYYRGNVVYNKPLPALTKIQVLIEEMYKSIEENPNIKEFSQFISDKSKFKKVKLMHKDKNILSEEGAELIIKDYLIIEQMSPELHLNLFFTGIEFNTSLESNRNEMNLLAAVVKSGVGIYIFDIEKKKVKFEIIKDLDLSGENISFCNGDNHLFISGKGLAEENNFAVIKLSPLAEDENNKLPAVTTLVTRSLFYTRYFHEQKHSMIFIPDRYIFLVGGYTKKVELFDTKENTFYNHSEMNQEMSNPQLALANNSVLYSFSGNINLSCNYSGVSNEISFFIFEKIDLAYIHSKWEVGSIKLEGGLRMGDVFSVIYQREKNDVIILNESKNEVLSMSSNSEGAYEINFIPEYRHNTNLESPFADILTGSGGWIDFIPVNPEESFTIVEFNKNVKIYKFEHNKYFLRELQVELI